MFIIETKIQFFTCQNSNVSSSAIEGEKLKKIRIRVWREAGLYAVGMGYRYGGQRGFKIPPKLLVESRNVMTNIEIIEMISIKTRILFILFLSCTQCC